LTGCGKKWKKEANSLLGFLPRQRTVYPDANQTKKGFHMRILIAEDEFTFRCLLSAILKKSGHEVVETENGAEAWDALQHPDAPRMAILDWMMPVMDGIDVVRRVRTLPSDRPPYLIMLTAKGKKADIITGLEAGADDYLTKPVDPGELKARVDVGLRMIEMQEALIKSREILAHQATHDSLTGMLNRRAILDLLHKELERARRHGDALAVGMCDIDHFKQINDSYGHQTGDEVLMGLAGIMNESLRNYDSVGRLGGEEFLVITPMKAGTDCASLFERLCLRISQSRIPTRSGDLSITVSIGAACADQNSKLDDMLEAADAALYRAKNGGRDRVAYAPQRCLAGEEPTCAS
jgi:diguanylate cyclase (GGDEF)-like protein